jgi:hypothetical protein
MTNYLTIVLRIPESEQDKKACFDGLAALRPFQTGMSQEDEMTTLEFIEQHDDFNPEIAEEARAKTREVHAAAEA